MPRARLARYEEMPSGESHVKALLLIVLCACQPYGFYAPRGGGYVASSAPVQEDTGESMCKSEYGTTVCGYHCVAEYGQVKCARTPEGSCTAQYGDVTCWDPPGHHYRERYYGGYGGYAPQSECKSEYGKTVCGYGCVADYGDVKCAHRPGGTCQAAYGSITCTD